jgi:hypothetical protein
VETVGGRITSEGTRDEGRGREREGKGSRRYWKRGAAKGLTLRLEDELRVE